MFKKKKQDKVLNSLIKEAKEAWKEQLNSNKNMKSCNSLFEQARNYIAKTYPDKEEEIFSKFFLEITKVASVSIEFAEDEELRFLVSNLIYLNRDCNRYRHKEDFDYIFDLFTKAYKELKEYVKEKYPEKYAKIMDEASEYIKEHKNFFVIDKKVEPDRSHLENCFKLSKQLRKIAIDIEKYMI